MVIARGPSATEGDKHEQRFYDGFRLGRAEGTNEHIVALPSNGFVMRFRTVKRNTGPNQYDRGVLRLVAWPWRRNLPLRPDGGDPEQDEGEGGLPPGLPPGPPQQPPRDDKSATP